MKRNFPSGINGCHEGGKSPLHDGSFRSSVLGCQKPVFCDGSSGNLYALPLQKLRYLAVAAGLFLIFGEHDIRDHGRNASAGYLIPLLAGNAGGEQGF